MTSTLGALGACHGQAPQQAHPLASASAPVVESAATPASSAAPPVSKLKFHLVNSEGLNMHANPGKLLFTSERGIPRAEFEGADLVSRPEHSLGLEDRHFYFVTFFGHWPEQFFLSTSHGDGTGGREASLFQWKKDKWVEVLFKRPRKVPSLGGQPRMAPVTVLPWANGSHLLVTTSYDTSDTTIQLLGGTGKEFVPKLQTLKANKDIGSLSQLTAGDLGRPPLATVVEGDLFVFGKASSDSAKANPPPEMASEHWVAGATTSTIDRLPKSSYPEAEIETYTAISRNEIYVLASVAPRPSGNAPSGRGLFLFNGKAWAKPDAAWQDTVLDLVETPEHTLWISTTKGELWSKSLGGAWRTEKQPVTTGPYSLQATSDGSMWASCANGELWHKPARDDWARVDLPETEATDKNTYYHVVSLTAEDFVLSLGDRLFRTLPASKQVSLLKGEEDAEAFSDEVRSLYPAVPYTPSCGTPLVVLETAPASSPPEYDYEAIRTALKGHHEFDCAKAIEFTQKGERKFALNGRGCDRKEVSKWIPLVKKRVPSAKTETLCYSPVPTRTFELPLDSHQKGCAVQNGK